MLGPLSYALHTSPRRHRRPSSLCSFLAEEGEERLAQRLPINSSSSSAAEEGRAARYGKMSSERRDSNPQPSARQADARPLRHTRTNSSWERDSNPRGLMHRRLCRPPPSTTRPSQHKLFPAESGGLEPHAENVPRPLVSTEVRAPDAIHSPKLTEGGGLEPQAAHAARAVFEAARSPCHVPLPRVCSLMPPLLGVRGH